MYLVSKDLSKDLNYEEICFLAKGAFEADRFFFNTIDISIADLELIISKMIGIKDSDYYHPNFIMEDNCALAVFFAYPFEEIVYRELISLRYIISNRPNAKDIKDKLKMFKELKPVISNDKSLYLSRIYVDTAFRGRGIGKFMLEELKSFATKLSLPSITLHCHSSNRHAMNFYHNLGFQIIAQKQDGYSYLELPTI